MPQITLSRLSEMFGNTIPTSVLKFVEENSNDSRVSQESFDEAIRTMSRVYRDKRVARAVQIAQGLLWHFEEQAPSEDTKAKFIYNMSLVMVAVFDDIDKQAGLMQQIE